MAAGKELKMSKKNSKHLKYALVAIDGQAWDFHVPSYLLGRLKEGDKVVIRRDGWFGVGEVECLMASTKHSEANVRTIVDKVKVKRWKHAQCAKDKTADLLAAAEKRAERLDEIANLKAKAEQDAELAGLMRAVSKMADDPALK